MPKLRVTIIDEVRNRRLKVDLPDDAAMEKLLPALAKKLGLPTTDPGGQPIAYRLTHEATGRALGGDQTLASFGAGEGETLRLAATREEAPAVPWPAEEEAVPLWEKVPVWGWVGIVVVVFLAVAALAFLAGRGVKPEPTPTVVAGATTPAAASVAVSRPTATPVAQTSTPLPPTDTPVPTSTPWPTATSVPPTATPVPTKAAGATAAPAAEKAYAGTTVTILGAAQEEQVHRFEESMIPFEERSGIDVVYEGSADFETIALVRAEAGDPFDIYNFPQPGLMADFARSGFLVDLGQFLDDAYMKEQYTQSWLDLGTVDGTLVGVWHNADVKSLVWYPVSEFEAAGYTVPETWDDMLALMDKMVADGNTPWCIGIESGGATGWPGTDWIEDIMLRTTSPENYDKWTRGELKFDSPEVRNAFDILGNIWFNEDYVYGGTTSILQTFFGDGPTPLFDDPPGCFMHRQASFIPHFFPEGPEQVGVDVNYFYLPPIDSAYGKPVLGSGSIMSMGKDTPAIRLVMEYLTTGESTKAEVSAGTIVAPHKDSSLDWYPDATTRGFAEILMAADTFRFDGSDLMPGAVGAGSFWTGMVDYVSGEDLDTILDTIDASWP